MKKYGFNVRKQLLTVKTFAKISIRRAFRDKMAIFFVFLFPLIFLFVFGGIFSNDKSATFNIALINQSDSSFAKQFVESAKKNSAFKIDDSITSLDQAQEKMSRSQLDGAIVLPKEFGAENNNIPSGQAKVYFTQNNEQAGGTLTSVMNAQFQEINKQFIKEQTPFTVASEQLNTKSLTRFDYIFAGLLGFSIIGLGIFGPVNYFPELKKQGVLRRLHTTPLKVWQYFTATVLSQTTIGFCSIALQFLVAILIFHLTWPENIISLTIFLAMSIVTILGIGLAIGGWAKNEQQAAPLSNIVVFPMLFLSGTFFPRFLMPEWLQKLSAFLPLTPVIDGIRLISTEGKTIFQIWPQVVMVGVWMVVIYIIAFRVFRWE